MARHVVERLIRIGGVALVVGSSVKPLYALGNGGGNFLGVGLAWVGADIWPLGGAVPGAVAVAGSLLAVREEGP